MDQELCKICAGTKVALENESGVPEIPRYKEVDCHRCSGTGFEPSKYVYSPDFGFVTREEAVYLHAKSNEDSLKAAIGAAENAFNKRPENWKVEDNRNKRRKNGKSNSNGN